MSFGLRRCGFQGWAFCDGNCEKCQTTATTHTLYNPIEIARQYAPKFDKPVVDMVEVVRCKDCKHRPIPNGNNHPLTPKPSEFEWDETCPYVCSDEWHNEMPNDNDFCSKGERKEVEE